MTKREIASLACKILAVYALLQIPQYLQGVYYFVVSLFTEELSVGNAQFQWTISATFIPTVLYLVVGILLWRRSNALAGRMVSDEQTEEEQCRLPGREFMAIAFSVVGLVVLVHAIPRITYLLARLVYRATPEFPGLGGGREWNIGTIAQLTALGVQVILGAVLFMSGQGLSQLAIRIHTAGQNNSEQESHTQEG